MTRRKDARAHLRALLWALACLFALPAAPAAAEMMNVNSTADLTLAVGANGCEATPGVCTLRAAMQRAASNGDPDDTIVLTPGLYQLTLTAGVSDPAEGDLDAQAEGSTPESLSIFGTSPRNTRIAGTGSERVLESSDSNMFLTITGVTISGGRAVTQGGGINAFGTLNLSNTTIVDNEVEFADGDARGAGIHAAGNTTILNTTITNNRALDSAGSAEGGGIYIESGAGLLSNVTISGNSAFDGGGGLFFGGGAATLQNLTVAGNTTTGTGGGISSVSGPGLNYLNTIASGNRANGAVSNCGGPPGASAGNNLEEGTDCPFTAAGDLRGVNPLLGPLAANDGLTDTHALLAGSPAIDAGSNLNCPSVDQRGKPRPQGAGCDIGAFEVQPSVLPPPPPPDGDDEPLPPPVLGRTVNVQPVSGKVTFAVPAGASAARAGASQKGLRFRPLSEARQLPVRSFLNTKKGTVSLTSARNRAGATQAGVFTRGLFQILQSRKAKAKGLTELRLKGSSFRSCKPRKRGKRAQAALSRKAIRRLRSNSRGRFRTRGRYSAATVRGTKWQTVDRCDGTLTKVTRGRVAVRDFRRKKTVIVRRGKSYLAKAPTR